MDASKIQELANELGMVAAVFDPQDAAAIEGLITIGTKLNNTIKDIRAQSELNSPQVWDEVRTNYAESLAAFDKSIQEHQVQP